MHVANSEVIEIRPGAPSDADAITVYSAPEMGGQGIGSRLYEALLPALRECGVDAAMGGIALPNEASIGLHEKLGFKKVAHFEQAGFKFNRWFVTNVRPRRIASIQAGSVNGPSSFV
jgi:L-amino acid N-acyltransferase YncA